MRAAWMGRIVQFCLTLAVGVLLGAGGVPGSAHAKTTFVAIGTGDVTGVYYPTGGAIAKLINNKRNEYGIRATIESTPGSVFNINAVMSRDIEFGVVQSDRQYQAVHGLAEWKSKGPQNELRAVFSIHPESVTLVATVDSNILHIRDLKGKRVNIGNIGSGQRQNAIDALKAVGIDYNRDLVAEGVKAAEAPTLLQDGRIDAFFYTVGHPSVAIKEATDGKRKVRFVTIDNVDKLLSDFPFYAKSVVPIGVYPSVVNTTDVVTFGVKATLVTSARVPERIVYVIAKEIFENFDTFKELHPAYQVMTRQGMLEGLSAPIHPGAMKYYKEAGLK